MRARQARNPPVFTTKASGSRAGTRQNSGERANNTATTRREAGAHLVDGICAEGALLRQQIPHSINLCTGHNRNQRTEWGTSRSAGHGTATVGVTTGLQGSHPDWNRHRLPQSFPLTLSYDVRMEPALSAVLERFLAADMANGAAEDFGAGATSCGVLNLGLRTVLPRVGHRPLPAACAL